MTFQEHIAQMRWDRVWETQVELHGAASFYQVLIYTCSPDRRTQEYRWLLHEALDQTNLLLEGHSCTQMQRNITHVDLYHANANHFHFILDNQDYFPTYPPQLNKIIAPEIYRNIPWSPEHKTDTCKTSGKTSDIWHLNVDGKILKSMPKSQEKTWNPGYPKQNPNQNPEIQRKIQKLIWYPVDFNISYNN